MTIRSRTTRTIAGCSIGLARRRRGAFARATCLVLAGLLVALVAGCSASSTSPSPTPTPTASPTPTPGFSPTGPLATARELHTATALPDGRVLIAGGDDGSKVLASAELYDPTTGTFSPTGPLATTRGVHTATLLPDGRVLIAGGANAGGPGAGLASADLYDPTTGTFSPTGPLATARGLHTATLLSDGRVLIVGGNDGSKVLALAELYDPTTGTFSPTGSMATARDFHTATLLSDGRVLIAGGYDGTRTRFASAELYDPATGKFSPTGSLATARSGHTATLLSGGRVLIAGGYDGSGYSTSAELYDPATGTFSPTGSMTTARYDHTATLLSDGRVLIAGGGTYDGVRWNMLAAAELYDPGTSKFSPTDSLATARDLHTATLLSDGRVLIAGGKDSSGPFASAELYQP